MVLYDFIMQGVIYLSSNDIQTVSRALTILRMFTEDKPKWGVQELSRAIDLPQSTVHRLLLTLESQSFLTRSNDDGCFYLGKEFISLAGVALNQLDLYRHSVSIISNLSNHLSLSITLAIPHNNQAMYITRADIPLMPAGVVTIGKHVPLFCTAVGRVLMAHMSMETIKDILTKEPITKFTRNTITDSSKLFEVLKEIRSEDYALEIGEFLENLQALAVPVKGKDGKVVASLAASGSLNMFDDKKVEDVLPQLRMASKNISFALGNPNVFL